MTRKTEHEVYVRIVRLYQLAGYADPAERANEVFADHPHGTVVTMSGPQFVLFAEQLLCNAR